MLVEDTQVLQLNSPGDMKLPGVTSNGLHQSFVNSLLISFNWCVEVCNSSQDLTATAERLRKLRLSNLGFPPTGQHLTKKLVSRPACGTVSESWRLAHPSFPSQTSLIVTLDVLRVLVYSFITLSIQQSIAQHVCKTSIPIFNPGIPAEGPTFHPFSRLPKEIRLLIWRHAIRRQRIIKVDISSPWLADPSTFLERVGDAFRGNARILA